VVLVVLAVIWGILLVSWLRSRTDRSYYGSVRLFRWHLSVIQKAAPATVRPANRLRGGRVPGGQPGLHRSAEPADPHGRPRYSDPHRRAPHPGSVLRSASAPRAGAGRPAGPVIGLRSPSREALRRRQSRQRRQDVLLALIAGMVGSLLVALIPGLRVVWAVQITLDILFLAYLALLARMRRLAVERADKVRFIAARPPAGPTRPAPDQSEGYGDLSLGRAAN